MLLHTNDARQSACACDYAPSQDAHATEKALAWLSAAHAEERALRGVARAEASAACESLASEREAHQAAVSRLVAEMEARARLALQVDSLKVCGDWGCWWCEGWRVWR
jgi:hypothetical protein